MNKNKIRYEDMSKIIKKRYVPAVILVALLIIIGQVIIQYEVRQDEYLSRIVNIAGRQRMLSQKITKDAYAIYLFDNQESRQFYLNELKTSVDMWKKSNIDLKVGNKSEGILINNSEIIVELFSEIEGNHQKMLNAAYDIINKGQNGSYDRNFLMGNIKVIESNEKIFLEGMDKIVFQYDKESKAKIAFLGEIEIILFLITLIIIFLEVKYIFIPAEKSVKSAFREMKKIASFDNLTGVYNRYFLDVKIDEMENLNINNEPSSIIILDIDRFKLINDTWGHPVGDHILKQTVKIVQRVIRKSDFLFRLGGEEFLVLLEKTSNKEALIVAEKIREAIERNEHTIVGKFTASFGVAEKFKDESFNSWYKRADEALYFAKESGRNCVICSDSQEKCPIALVHFEWKHEWESGNKEIDRQHKELLQIANSLIYKSLLNSEYEKTTNQLEHLISHIVKHFEYEEQVLLNIGYPEYEKHKEIHKTLIENALKFKESYFKGDLRSSAIFSFLIDDVIVGHILECDAKFFSYTKNKQM